MKQLHFIIGVAPRSGTSYLGDLISLHPDCSLPNEIPEDGLLIPVDNLVNYAQRASAFWEMWTERDTPGQSDVESALGRGLAGLICQRADKPVIITKTPFPTHLSMLSRFFPDSRVIVIVRDGRSVVESTRRSWGSPLDVAAARYRDGAREVLRAMDMDNGSASSFYFVRYEDLLDRTHDQLKAILEFLRLNPEEFPFEQVATLPLRGSSQHSTGKQLDWKPVERPQHFAGAKRWESLTKSERQVFAAIAGKENARLGYEQEPVGPVAAVLASMLAVRRQSFNVAPKRLQELLKRLPRLVR